MPQHATAHGLHAHIEREEPVANVLLVVAASAAECSVWRRRFNEHGLPLRECHPDQLCDQQRLGSNQLLLVPAPPASSASALDLVRELRARSPSVPLVLLIEQSSEETAIAALRLGVSDYHRVPCPAHAVIESVLRWMRDAVSCAGKRPRAEFAADGMIGDSRRIRELREYIRRLSATDSSVLITGETGVGKELVAELIHAVSPRGRRPCVAINCAAIPDSLLESELFGHERGAFTDADAQREGALKSADGGTILLDEVGDMGLSAQAKILRAIEAREVRRVGGRVQVPIDVRIIAATNQNLERLVEVGQFRKDLYYRLNVVRVHLPPLRERKEDLELLLNHYIRYFNARFNRDVEGFTPEAIKHLHRYHWPGNIREVRNLVEATFVNLNGRRIAYVDLPEPFRITLENSGSLPADERERVLSALFSTSWNMSRAAQELNWSRMTLYRKLAKHQITRSDRPR